MTVSSFMKKHSGQGGVVEMLYLALPMIVSTACDGVMIFTDRYFLARLGSEYMNAAMGGGVMAQTLMFFFIGLTGYSNALAAQYMGSGRKHMSPVAAFQAMLIVIVASPLIMASGPLAAEIIVLVNIPPEQQGPQTAYFSILVYGAALGLLRNCLSCYFSGIGRTRVVMTATLAALMVNVGLDYLLIFGNFGFPQLGIRGAALATLAGQATALTVLFLVYVGGHNRREFSVMESFHFNREAMTKLLRYGYPAGVEFFLNFLAFSAIIMIFHARGSAAATASTIMFNWDMVSFIPLLGIEIAVTSLSGRYMGAGRPDIAHRSAMSAIKTGMVYSALIFILFVFFPRSLAMVFSPEGGSAVFDEALPIAVSMIRIASIYVLAESVMVALIGALRGAGDTHFTMILSVTAHWMFVPMLYLMLHVAGMPVIAGWLFLVMLFMVFCLALIIRYRGGKWKLIRIVAPAEAS
jgi:MATE family multidrug resistance protein